MAYTLKVNYADKSNYGSARSTSKIKYIVWHYTANDGDTDEANAKYFKRRKKQYKQKLCNIVSWWRSLYYRCNFRFNFAVY